MQIYPRKFILFMGGFLLLFFVFSIYSQLELPAPRGNYSVGRTIFRWVDTSRLESLTEDPNDFREVVTLVWYPAEPRTGVNAGYFPNLSSVSQTLVESGEVEWWEVFGLRFVRSESQIDPHPLELKDTFPIVIFSPGNGTNIEFYSSLASEIASHGYIVFGINHPYDVAAVEISDGRVTPYNKDQWSLEPKAHQAYTAERIKVRTADVLFVLGQIKEMNAKGPFSGVMNLDTVAVAGHSLGGITASEACKADKGFKACLNLDGLQQGGPFSVEETAVPPEQPFLFLTKESKLPAKLLEQFESMHESYWVVLHGAFHQSFTDGPLLQPSLLPGWDQAEHFMDLIQKYTLAFLDYTLEGKPNSLLAKTASSEVVSVNVFPSH